MNTFEKFAKLTSYITKEIPGIRTVQLVKLIYFIEYNYLINFGECLTEVPIVRIDMGPVPEDYRQRFRELEEGRFIRTKSEHGGTAFYSGKRIKYPFAKNEFELIDLVIEPFRNIIIREKYHATEIIKGLSYQTKPMRRYTEREERDGFVMTGGCVLVAPYFTESEVDSLAAYRRAYRDHLMNAANYSKEDAQEDKYLLEDFTPLLREASVSGEL